MITDTTAFSSGVGLFVEAMREGLFVKGCRIDGFVTGAHISDGDNVDLTGNFIEGGPRGVLIDGGQRVIIRGGTAAGSLFGIEITGSERPLIDGVQVESGGQGVSVEVPYARLVNLDVVCDEDGIVLSDTTERCRVTDCMITNAAASGTNLYSGIVVDGERNYISGNVIPAVQVNTNALNNGISILGNCSRVVGNDLDDPGAYGNDAIDDLGTLSELFFPDDPVYGDNFTDCSS
jgi:hypothetical protein